MEALELASAAVRSPWVPDLSNEDGHACWECDSGKVAGNFATREGDIEDTLVENAVSDAQSSRVDGRLYIGESVSTNIPNPSERSSLLNCSPSASTGIPDCVVVSTDDTVCKSRGCVNEGTVVCTCVEIPRTKIDCQEIVSPDVGAESNCERTQSVNDLTTLERPSRIDVDGATGNERSVVDEIVIAGFVSNNANEEVAAVNAAVADEGGVPGIDGAVTAEGVIDVVPAAVVVDARNNDDDVSTVEYVGTAVDAGNCTDVVPAAVANEADGYVVDDAVSTSVVTVESAAAVISVPIIDGTIKTEDVVPAASVVPVTGVGDAGTDAVTSVGSGSSGKSQGLEKYCDTFSVSGCQGNVEHCVDYALVDTKDVVPDANVGEHVSKVVGAAAVEDAATEVTASAGNNDVAVVVSVNDGGTVGVAAENVVSAVATDTIEDGVEDAEAVYDDAAAGEVDGVTTDDSSVDAAHALDGDEVDVDVLDLDAAGMDTAAAIPVDDEVVADEVDGVTTTINTVVDVGNSLKGVVATAAGNTGVAVTAEITVVPDVGDMDTGDLSDAVEVVNAVNNA